MRLKNRYWWLIIIFFFGTNFPLVYASISEKYEKKSNSINLEYLRNLPSNDYIIGPGDQLKIIISRDYPELDTISIVDREGTIYLPKLNRIYVNQLSVNELNEILNKAYLKFVKYPSVEVNVDKYRAIKVFVEGEVKNPGLMTLSGSLSLRQNKGIDLNSNNTSDFTLLDSLENVYFPTVFDAIRQSGGVTKYSDLSAIQIIRKANLSSGSDRITTTINLENVLLTGDNSQNIRIYNSDIINVKKSEKPNNVLFAKAILSNINPKFINVFVFGRVNQPGNIKVSRLGTLGDAIEIAGGAKVIRGPLTFLRFNNDGTIDKRKFRYRKNASRGSFKNPLLEDGDLIVVGKGAISSANEIVSEVTAPFTGILSTYGLIKAVSD